MPWFPRTRKGKQRSSTTSEPNSPPPITNPHLPQSTETETSLVLAEPPAENLHDALSRNPNTPRFPLPTDPSSASTNPTNPLKRINKYGLLPLHIPSSHDSPAREDTFPIDIVAVHGITGDAYNTWEDKESKTLWLRDFLPDELPGARIYTYGYRAEVLFSHGTGDVKSFANGLLGDLGRVRRGAEDQRRPIIFICHSMGGIVVKKALNLALVDSEWHENIRTSTFAILFLATPHRGSDSAAILSLLAKIANVGLKGTNRVTGHIRSGLIKTLEKDSAELKEIAGDFRSNLREIKVASFIEQELTRVANKKIVDKNTGLMDTPGEQIVDMEGCDHKRICRFRSRTDMGYERVLHVLMGYAREATNKVILELASEDLPCLHSLAFAEMDRRELNVNRAHPNTCGWVLGHPSYTTWMNRGSGLLWVKGHPGTGKSTLMAFLSQTFQKDAQDLSLQFFFHGGGTTLQKTQIGMLRALLHQLFMKTLSPRGLILKAFREKKASGEPGQGWEWHLNELQDLLFAALAQITKKRTLTILVDALDEAGTEAAGDLLRFFHRLNDQAARDHSYVKICISCRHYPVVSNIPGLVIDVGDENYGDISTFVRDELRKLILSQEHELSSIDNLRVLEDAIVQKSSGVFQWASIVVPKVIDLYTDGESFEDVYQVLEAEPKELFDLYQNILKNIIKAHGLTETLHLMQWICLAERPLSVTELRYAMACDDSRIRPFQMHCEDSKGFVESDTRMQKKTRSLSGGLAEVRYHEFGTTVQFIHQTVNDFLLSRGFQFLFSVSDPAQSINRDFVVGHSEDRLSRSCINYLRLGEVRREDREWFKSVQQELFFIEYVTKYWVLHAERAEKGGVSQESLVEQFKSPPETFETWIKSYNALDSWSHMCPAPGASLLHLSASANLRSTASVLLRTNSLYIEAEDESKSRALHYAAQRGHKEMVLMLLHLSAEINPGDRFDRTPLERAAANGHEEVVEILLGKGAQVNQRTGESGNALQAASLNGNIALVKSLIANGAQVNAQGGDHNCALQAAARRGHLEIVRFLLDEGARINLQGGWYGNALQAAACCRNEAIFQLLLSRGARTDLGAGYFGNALQAAAFSGNLNIVRRLLGAGVEPDREGGNYGNALQAACFKGNEDVARCLIEKCGPESVNTQVGQYGNALQAAACSGRKSLVQFLIDKGADVNSTGGEYNTALQAAAHAGHPEIVQLLLDHGAAIDVENGDILHSAVRWNITPLIDRLIKDGAQLNAVHIASGTPLHSAAKSGHIQAVELLLEAGADINTQGGTLETALQAAVAYGHLEVVKLLLKRGADVNVKGGLYGNALGAASGDQAMIKTLRDWGAESTRNIMKDE